MWQLAGTELSHALPDETEAPGATRFDNTAKINMSKSREPASLWQTFNIHPRVQAASQPFQ